VLVKKSNNQVLVKKAVRAVYPVSGGGPVMMLGSGGGGGPRGRTLRERAGGTLGGLIGVAGALTGSHRSLGGLANAMVSGGATGSQLGSALGRKFVGREGQARADLREAGKQADAKRNAEMMEATRSRGEGVGSRLNPYAAYAGVRRRFNPDFQGNERLESMAFNPFAAVRRRNFAVGQEEDERLRRATQRNEAVAATRAEQDKENKRMGVAVRTGMYRDAGRTMGEEARRYEDMGRKVEEMVPNFMAGAETFTRVNVPQEDSVDQRMKEMAQLPPAQKLLPPSDPELTAAGELNQQVRPEDVDADTEGEVSDNEYQTPPTPQGDASELTPEQKKVLVRSLRRGEDGQE